MTEPWLLGRYEIVAELGKGAMGVVYRANDPMLNRILAIKTINTEEAGHEGMAEYEARFYTEAKAAGSLNHPNIIIIYDIGKSGHLVYMAMEYIEGRELRDLLAQGQSLPVVQAVDIAAQVGEGLAYAHQHQVVHRDIKPANIMITPEGRAKIADFGIARMRSSETRTQTGVIMGSPKYMSPEQVIGKRADHRSDIFSLGVILYEMLVGAAPFNGENVTALMYQIVNFVPPAPSSVNDAVPELLDYIVAKSIAKPLEERYPDAAELARDLRECERQLAAAGPAVNPAAATHTQPLRPVALAPTPPQPKLVDPAAQSSVLAQPVSRTREADRATEEAPSPAHGLASSFD